MDYTYGLAIGIHTLASVIWVGGMFFAHMVLRPALGGLEPAQRLGVWREVFPRFFFWVWISIVALLASGYGVLLVGFRAGFAGGPNHVDIMQLTGLVMMALYVQLFFGPWRGFKRAFAEGDMARTAEYQTRIRHIVTVNLALGLLTILIGTVGALLGA